MILSGTSKAAIKAVVLIASRMEHSDFVQIKEIVRETKENEHTLRKVLQLLVRNGFINSAQGVNGGFSISDDQMDISLYRLISLIDGAEHIKVCILGLEQCNEQRPCPLHNHYKDARTLILQSMKKNTIRQLAASLKEGNVFLNKILDHANQH